MTIDENARRQTPTRFEPFALDIRSLAVMRIVMGTCLLMDVLRRLPFVEAHYSDAGVLPRAARLQLGFDFGTSWWTSPHMLCGEPSFQAFLFALAAIAAVCLVVGLQTRIATLVSLILLLGVQARHPLLLQGGDVVLRCELFWSLFVPLGAAWSLDGLRQPAQPMATRVKSFGTAALVLQLCFVYWFTAALKTDVAWVRTFDAAYFAIQSDHFTSPLGYWLSQYPRFLRMVTLATLVLEFIGPLMIFVPWRNHLLRSATVLAFAGMHIGLQMCLDLGLFSYICIGYWLMLLPTEFWTSVAHRLRLETSRATMAEHAESLRTGGWFFNSVVAALVCLVLFINLRRMQQPPYTVVLPVPLDVCSRVTGLSQHWPMFAPGPPNFRSWYLVLGELADGTVVDLRQPTRSASTAKPQSVSQSYQSSNWRRCFMYLIEAEEPAHRRGLADFFHRRWNAMHPDQPLASVEVVMMYQMTAAPFSEDVGSIERLTLYHWPDVSKGLISVAPGRVESARVGHHGIQK